MLKNIQTYRINSLEDGTLEKYPNSWNINISKNEWYFIENPNIKYNLIFERIKSTDTLKAKLCDKYVYRLREDSNNGDEICISLTLLQNIKFNIMNGTYLEIINNKIEDIYYELKDWLKIL
jgi:hypothetical protein